MYRTWVDSLMIFNGTETVYRINISWEVLWEMWENYTKAVQKKE